MQHPPAPPSSTASGPSESDASPKWPCVECTYENWSSSHRCTMCRSPRPSSARIPIYGEDADSPAARSSSPPCLEHQQQIICDSKQQQSNKWACHMCTYLNWASSLKCVQCLTTRIRVSPANSVGAIAAAVSSHASPRASPPTSLVGVCGGSTYAPSTSGMSSLLCGALENQLRIKSNDTNNERNKRILTPTTSSLSTYSNHNSNIRGQSPTHGCPPSSPSLSHPASTRIGSTMKWSCSVCTYKNWPRSQVCVLCGSKPEPATIQQLHQSSSNRDSPSPPAAVALSAHEQLEQQQLLRSLSPCIETTAAADKRANNYDYERRIRQLRRRMREADWSWLTACMGVVEGDANPVEAYINGGGDPTRKLTKPEVVLLNRPSVYETGHTLIHLAIRFHRENILATLLSIIEGVGSGGDIKCVPSYVAPDLASVIRRHIGQCQRQRKGHFNCYYITEWATYTLPPEIDDLPPATQEQLYSELLDRDVQKELEEDNYIINWSVEVRTRLHSRLYALWNRSAGDCLLDSVLQATWGVLDRDNVLRKAMSDSLHQAGHIFYSRWREWEIQQALELGFSLHESQLADDWTALLHQASQPGASLEQMHVFCLAHVLRRPIIVYGVKYVKSWKGENLGYARFEGVYLPLLWESSFCSRSPIALGYTRGHFSALVPPEPNGSASGHPGAAASFAEEFKACFLPLMTCDQKVLPVHFLNESELGKEEMILRQWLDVGVTDSGLWVAQQKIAKPPLLVAQMTEEWLNHYRKIAQSSIAPLFNSRTSGNNVRSSNNSNASFCLTAPHNSSTTHNSGPSSLSASCNAGSSGGSAGSASVGVNTSHGGVLASHKSVANVSGGGGYSSEGESDDE